VLLSGIAGVGLCAETAPRLLQPWPALACPTPGGLRRHGHRRLHGRQRQRLSLGVANKHWRRRSHCRRRLSAGVASITMFCRYAQASSPLKAMVSAPTSPLPRRQLPPQGLSPRHPFATHWNYSNPRHHPLPSYYLVYANHLHNKPWWKRKQANGRHALEDTMRSPNGGHYGNGWLLTTSLRVISRG
jgi:hypothetical protein